LSLVCRDVCAQAIIGVVGFVTSREEGWLNGGVSDKDDWREREANFGDDGRVARAAVNPMSDSGTNPAKLQNRKKKLRPQPKKVKRQRPKQATGKARGGDGAGVGGERRGVEAGGAQGNPEQQQSIWPDPAAPGMLLSTSDWTPKATGSLTKSESRNLNLWLRQSHQKTKVSQISPLFECFLCYRCFLNAPVPQFVELHRSLPVSANRLWLNLVGCGHYAHTNNVKIKIKKIPKTTQKLYPGRANAP
jgi:hypothetical protein